jgi:hypothetical protein
MTAIDLRNSSIERLSAHAEVRVSLNCWRSGCRGTTHREFVDSLADICVAKARPL